MAFIAQRKEDPMPHISSGAALVTGASSGIGRATACAVAAAGYPTVATARHPEALADLAAAGCHTLALDVTDEGSLTRAVRAVEDAHGGIAALINNAGYAEMGPLEEVPIAAFRRWPRSLRSPGCWPGWGTACPSRAGSVPPGRRSPRWRR